MNDKRRPIKPRLPAKRVAHFAVQTPAVFTSQPWKDGSSKELQDLDSKGYSGHLSYILFMLDQPKFRATYLAGDFKPEEIVEFGKRHGIIINRMVGN